MMPSLCGDGPENQIKEAAKKIFLEKGFDGATMKEIAQAAGMNSALTHYYFRSKEKLFWLVFEGLLHQMMEGIQGILESPTDLKTKIINIIEQQYTYHLENPSVVLFLMKEAQRDPVGLFQKMGVKSVLQNSSFVKQVEEAVQGKQVRPISPVVLLALLFSSIKQVFAGKTLHMHLFELDEVGFTAYVQEHKKLYIDMLLRYLYD